MILITGGAGYIGSHCALKLIENGQDIIIFDSLDTGHKETVSAIKSLNTKGQIKEFINGNLQNFEDINRVFKKYSITSVIHFGAFSQVSESTKDPQKYYYNNVYGSMNLFKAMIENGVKNLIFSSSAAVYGEPEYSPIDELHPKKPINPYGATKCMIERILDDYDKAYGLKSIRLRYFNVAGADSRIRIGEWHEPETHLIPNILKASFKGNPTFKLYGDNYNTPDGTCIRDYINIEDLVNAHLLAVDYLTKSQRTDIFNLGTAEGNSVKDIFKLCEKVTGEKINLSIEKPRKGDPATLISDSQKAKTILGWEIKNSTEQSIKTAYEWEKLKQGKT